MGREDIVHENGKSCYDVNHDGTVGSTADMCYRSVKFFSIFSKNDLYRGNFMRGMVCAHS
jgi:hypothetical protein